MTNMQLLQYVTQFFSLYFVYEGLNSFSRFIAVLRHWPYTIDQQLTSHVHKLLVKIFITWQCYVESTLGSII